MICITANEAMSLLKNSGLICSFSDDGIAIKSHDMPGKFVREVTVPYVDSIGSLVSKTAVWAELTHRY